MLNFKGLIIYGLIFFVSATMTLAQQTKLEKPIECKSKSTAGGKFKTLFVGFSGGSSFQVSIQVDVKDQTDKNYLAIANKMKAKYCKEEKMYVAFFDSKEHRKLYSIPQPERLINGYPRALYFLDRKNEKEIFQIYKVLNGKIETRILDIDL
jgi:hypothetical protein